MFPLYGIFRYLYLVHQKEGGGSPADMLLNDRPLLACVALWAMSVAGIIYWNQSDLNGQIESRRPQDVAGDRAARLSLAA